MYQTALIKKPKPEDDNVRYPDGLTKDIIETVLYANKKAAWYTSLFAPTLRKKTGIETCRAIWSFVKTQIPYKVDPTGEQWIKSPGRLWKDKLGDCKSFSVFTASCLKNLGIPYGYRFASYSQNDPTATHVYVYVPLAGGGEIILDSVWTGPFNSQKPYTFKQDKLMSKISYLGSVGTTASKHVPGVLKLTKDVADISDGEMDLLIARQRLEIEKANSAAVGGPFNWQLEKYDQAIGVINHALSNIDNPAVIEGIGDDMIGRAKRKGKKKSGGGFFKKIGRGIAKGFKAVTRVLSFPLRMVAKGILEIYLPKAAMMFLYLFAEEKMLTVKMKAKRKKSQKFKDFIVNKIGMKDKHFMGIVRNSLTKKLRMSPESYMAKALRSVAVKGIGSPGYNQAKSRVNGSIGKHPKLTRSTAIIEKSSGSRGSGITQEAFNNAYDFNNTSNYDYEKPKKTKKKFDAAGLVNVGAKAATGDYIGAIIAAVQWVINKLGGKKEGVNVSANDIPNIEEDAGKAITWDNVRNADDIPENVKNEVESKAGQYIDSGLNAGQATERFNNQFENLTPQQRKDLGKEVESGYDPLNEEETIEMARSIKNQGADTLPEMEKTGGRAAPGMCNC